MNERIKELAEQAGAETWSRAPMRAITGLAFTDENLEKFAELIVQECLLALEPDPMAPAINYDVEQKFYQRSADKIKKHFGVEE